MGHRSRRHDVGTAFSATVRGSSGQGTLLSFPLSIGRCGFVPSKIILGWLYVRHGIEAAILVSFMSGVVDYLLLAHVFVQFA